MTSNLNNIFLKSTCLTNNEMLAYLSDDLSVNKHKVELHLTDCEMCSDELEGLSNMKNLKELPLIISNLNEKINTYYNKEEKIIPLNTTQKSQEKNNKFNFKKVFSIAASIILLVTVGYFINNLANTETKDFAQVEIPKENKKEVIAEPLIVKEEITENDDNTSEINENKKLSTEEKKSSKELNKEKNENIDKIAIVEDVEEAIVTSKNLEEEENKEKKEVITNEIAESTNETSTLIADNDDDEANIDFSMGNTRGGINTKKKATIDYLHFKKSGLLAYNINSYKDAIIDFEKYLKSNSNDFEVIYKTGMSYFKLKNYSKAISKFNIIISKNNSKYIKNAKLYKEKALNQ